jgi:hypothetical protein
MSKPFEKACTPVFVLALLSSVTLSCTCGTARQTTSEPETTVTLEPAATPTAKRNTGSKLNRQSPVGTNLSGVRDWTSELPFVDIFKASRDWISCSISSEKWSDDRSVDIDEHGWVRSLKPDQCVRTLGLWGVKHYPVGKYIVLYDGEGEIEYHGAGSNRLVAEESRPGRHVIDLDPKRGEYGLALVLKRTNPKNPIRNIRVLMPGGVCTEDFTRWCDDKHPCEVGTCEPFERNHEEVIFNPQFVDRIRRYSVLRFMKWMEDHDIPVRKWTDRPQLDDARWTTHGVPLEIMVELANRIQAEPWFNMPHRANDDYVRRSAERVHELLDPKSRAWVEFSNEVWNGEFRQNRDVAECESGRGEDGTYAASHLCYAERSIEIFRIWRTAFGKDQVRVVRVLGGQIGGLWASERIMKHKDAYKHADVFAVAPYFGVIASPENADEVRAMSVAEVLAQTREKSLPETLDLVKKQQALAGKYGLPLVAYEGGTDFRARGGLEDDAELNALFDAASRDPGIAEVYTDALNGWRDAGGQLFIHYVNCMSYSMWGRWGLLEYMDQPRDEAPKFDAMERFIDNHPRWW